MKQYILTAVLVLMVLYAGFASAPLYVEAQRATGDAALEELIKSLTAQVNSLKGELKAREIGGEVTSGVVGVGIVPAAQSGTKPVQSHRVCRLLNRSLMVGSVGDDVKGLQEYLSTEGYLSASPTGYYGPLTERAVMNWQANEGLSTAGVVGPLTRARIAKRCMEPVIPPVLPPLPQPTLSASPVSGSAPLKVTFSTWISGFRAPGITYTLDFGDGTSVTPASCLAPADACIEPGKDTHVYKKDGTYIATLYRINDICNGNPLCMAPISRETVGTATVVVGMKACTLEYNPVCGAKPIVCITTPCDPIPQTYGNRCAMEADGATLLYRGECKVASGNLPPVISSLTGPTTLDVGEKGVWTVKASDPEKGALTYTVTWGDELPYVMTDAAGMAAPMRMREQTTTFSHSYATAGTYTVMVVVSDREGSTAETTTTVEVGSEPVACTKEYKPVCGLPPGCANTCPSGMYCAMLCQMPTPVTYSNTCLLKAAGASFLHDGVCTVTSGYPTM